ncbi:MAG: amino acid--tRNA ligase-related protein [Nitrospiraceae bacterium]
MTISAAMSETILSNEFRSARNRASISGGVESLYMQTDPARTDLALCMDVLAPEGYGEIIGGGQRIHEYDKLLARLHEHHLPLEAFQWYLDLRRYGLFLMRDSAWEIERAVAWICGLEHVRETIPFPRMLYRLYP